MGLFNGFRHQKKKQETQSDSATNQTTVDDSSNDSLLVDEDMKIDSIEVVERVTEEHVEKTPTYKEIKPFADKKTRYSRYWSNENFRNYQPKRWCWEVNHGG